MQSTDTCVTRCRRSMRFRRAYRVRGIAVKEDQLGLASASYSILNSVSKMVNFSMISWYAVLFGSVRAQCTTLLPFREGKISAPSNDSAHGVS